MSDPDAGSPIAQRVPRGPHARQFTIKTVITAFVCLGLSLGWWSDRERLKARHQRETAKATEIREEQEKEIARLYQFLEFRAGRAIESLYAEISLTTLASGVRDIYYLGFGFDGNLIVRFNDGESFERIVTKEEYLEARELLTGSRRAGR